MLSIKCILISNVNRLYIGCESIAADKFQDICIFAQHEHKNDFGKKLVSR